MASGLWQPKLAYTCSCCGKPYEGSPSFAYLKPVYYFDVPEAEREARIKIDDDLCYIRAAADDPDDHDIYAIRCTLDIPIRGVEAPFSWGVWASQSQENFWRYVETYNSDQSGDGSFGWLAVSMPYYDRSQPGEPLESLVCNVVWGKKGQRPKIMLQETDHPLYRDQADGIDWETAVMIAQTYLKGAHATES